MEFAQQQCVTAGARAYLAIYSRFFPFAVNPLASPRASSAGADGPIARAAHTFRTRALDSLTCDLTGAFERAFGQVNQAPQRSVYRLLIREKLRNIR